MIALTPALQFGVLGLYVTTVGLVIWLDPAGWFWIDVALFAMALAAPLVFGAGCVLGWWVSRERGSTRPDGSEFMVATTGNVLTGAAFALSLFLWGALIVLEYGLRDF